MARRAPKKQARRNGGSGTPGWVWLLVGVLGGLAIAVVLFVQGYWGKDGSLLPQPNPQARAPTPSEEPVAQREAPEPKKPKYDFYDVLRDKKSSSPTPTFPRWHRPRRRRPPTPWCRPTPKPCAT